MSYTLRPYQEYAVTEVINWVKKTIDPALLELPTGAGKSLVIADLAKKLTSLSGGKKVLVLQPSRELLTQNSEKYKLTGEKFSLFSASLGVKSIRNSVIFATPLTVKGSLSKFDNQFCAIIMDESHLLTPTIIKIIDSMRSHNPNLRVIGLTATPFSMNGGLLYQIDENDKPVSQDKAKDPYFKKLIYKLSARYLIDNGWLTPPVIGSVGDRYDTSGLEIKSGKYTSESIDRAFVGLGRRTSMIVEEIVHKAQGHRTVMIFGATVAHCKEIMSSLPPDISRMIDGKTPKGERERIINQTKQGLVKYLVSCETLTTGVDIESVSIIAILRATLSPVLITQIIGRALRVYPGKKEALILDFTTSNIDNFFPDGDLFSIQIKPLNSKKSSIAIQATCPDCGTVNQFSARKNDEGYDYDQFGYFVDLMGNRIKTDYGDMPSHHGRRCYGQELIRGNFVRCPYRWTFKACPHCEAENDISARHCVACRCEIIDPNQKLIADFRARIRDPYQTQCDKVLDWKKAKTLSKKQEEMLVIEWITEHRKFVVFYLIRRKEYGQLMQATQGGDIMPDTISYRKDKDSGFFKALGYNQPAYHI
jgi:DNA repair protein RadD